jgi:outer membrane protein TolC
MKQWSLVGLVLIAGWSAAAEYPDLPPEAAVDRALAANPAVRAAAAGVRVAQASREQLAAGSHEFNLRLGAQRRRVDDAGQSFGEWDVGLERPLRLPTKARLDGEIGAQGVEQAELAYLDARHESARALLRNWFAWLRSRAEAQQWEEQVALLREQVAVIGKRVKAGDAARLDRQQAEAALVQAEASQAQAQARSAIAANEVRLRFPGIPLPSQPALHEPPALERGAEFWREQILAHNHELALARSEARRGQLGAARSSADRMPDPTLGLRYASERGGAERIVGVSVAIPLPGEGRSAAAELARADADAAASREAGVLNKLEAEAANAYLAARSAHDNWQNLRRAAERVSTNADLVARAYGLGEGSLSEVLVARRMAIEARLAATAARLDAGEVRYRLLLDSHQLWPLHGTDGGDVRDRDHLGSGLPTAAH